MKNKYRAWDIRNKQMVENALLLSGTNQLVTVNADYFNSPFSFFDGCIWVQCINAVDKNDVEIYERDILQTKSGSKICFDNAVDYHLWSYRNSIDFKDVEIIGNSMANPELLP